MSKIWLSAAALLLAAACIAGSTPAAAPVIRLAFYAPQQVFHQPDLEAPPVHIVGLESTRGEIRWVVSNTSDKAVASVIIRNEMAPPPGCSTKAGHGEGSESGSRYLVSIAPHGTAVASRDDHYPMMAVVAAKDWGTSYLQVQFGVVGVFFRDGSAWPTPIDDYPHTVFWDPKLLESAARNCSNSANVAPALDMVDIEDINAIVFERGTSHVGDFDEEHSGIPQLHFSCSLEGPKAICHMPLEHKKASGSPVQANQGH